MGDFFLGGGICQGDFGGLEILWELSEWKKNKLEKKYFGVWDFFWGGGNFFGGVILGELGEEIGLRINGKKILTQKAKALFSCFILRNTVS